MEMEGNFDTKKEPSLVIPQPKHEEAWKAFIFELNECKERIIPFSVMMGDGSYKSFMQITEAYSHKELVPNGYVAANTYFLSDGVGSVVYGVVNIRHELNENLLNFGGHIGYGVAPSHRRKGYATLMLSLALEKCRELGLSKVLVICNKDNTGSARTIKKCGGVFENELTEADGTVVQRYWISVAT